MPTHEVHCEECLIKMGDEHKQVHKYLDRFAGIFGSPHRLVRHHTRGLVKIRELFGEKGEQAGRMHMIADMRRVPYYEDVLYQAFCTNKEIYYLMIEEFGEKG